MSRFSLYFSFLPLVLKRLSHHAGLSLSSALGILSILSLVICVPVFSSGILSQVLQEQLAEKASRNQRAMFSLHVYFPDNTAYSNITLESANQITSFIQGYLENQMELEVNEIVMNISSSQLSWSPEKVLSRRPEFSTLDLSFFSSSLLGDKIRLTEGQWPEVDAGLSNPIQVAILEDVAEEYFLNIGDVYKSGSMTIEIVGIFRPIDLLDPAWFYNPQTTFHSALWVPMTLFQPSPHTFLDRPLYYTSWYAIVNDRSLRFSQSLEYTRQMTRLENTLLAMLPKGSIDYSPVDMLKAYEARLKTMILLFYAAGAPMFALALMFVWLTASIAVGQHEQETAVLSARGISKTRIIVLNLAESLMLIILVLPFALLVGRSAAVLMGQTRLFLQFTHRPGTVFDLADTNLLWLSLAVVAVLGARLAPLLFGSWPTISLYKQERARSTSRPFWERYYLDLFLFIPSAYAYIALRGRLRTPAAAPDISPQTSYDPLMFLASSIFIFALSMLILRLFPLLLRFVAALTARLPNTWIYLALQELSRKPRDHASAILLIMVSLSFSVFSASMAKTLDLWLRDTEYYRAGSDLVIKEYKIPAEDSSWDSTLPAATDPYLPESQVVEGFVNLDEKIQLPEIDSGTFVGTWPCRFSLGSSLHECTLMGIDRLSFPGTGFFRRDFAAPPLGALMNALVSQPQAVLIPQDLAQETGLRNGDLIQIEPPAGVFGQAMNTSFQIAEVYRYFPTVYPAQKFTLIADLESLFGGKDAISGVNTWLKLAPDASPSVVLKELRQAALRDGRWIDVLGDARSAVLTTTSQPEWVGLFGILNVGFFLTGLLPGIGFVLYSFSLLRTRLAQFGILQALGLSTSQTAYSLILEQVLLMTTALAGGAGVGFTTSALFLPFLQTNLAGTAPTPPFLVLIGWSETGWLCLVFGGIFAITLAFMLVSLSRLKIFQALKLGEEA